MSHLNFHFIVAVISQVAAISQVVGGKLGKTMGEDAQLTMDSIRCTSIFVLWTWATYMCMIRAVQGHDNGVVLAFFMPVSLGLLWGFTRHVRYYLVSKQKYSEFIDSA